MNTVAVPKSTLGAHVLAWDFSVALTREQCQEIKQQLAHYGVLIFREHEAPDDDQLVAFAASFGSLIEGAAFFGEGGSHPNILRVNNLRNESGLPLGVGGAEACDWHSDYAYLPTCGVTSFLDAQIVPPTGGVTYFASTYTALDSIDKQERDDLAKLYCYHDTLAADRNIRVEEASEKQERLGDEIVAKPNALHPLVMSHPDTGRKGLYVNPMLTRYIKDIGASESHRLLERFYALIMRDQNIYAHRWQAGDLVMWDNIGLIHRRDCFDPHETRSMRQLTTLKQ